VLLLRLGKVIPRVGQLAVTRIEPLFEVANMRLELLYQCGMKQRVLSPSPRSNNCCDRAFGFLRLCETRSRIAPHAEDQVFRGRENSTRARVRAADPISGYIISGLHRAHSATAQGIGRVITAASRMVYRVAVTAMSLAFKQAQLAAHQE
jgi:hypothetical protein